MAPRGIAPAQAVWGFEFGNELSQKTTPAALAHDYVRLRQLIDNVFPEDYPRPHLIGPDDNPDNDYICDLLSLGAGPVIDVFTYHNYVGYGLDANLSAEIMTTKFLNQGWENAAGPVGCALKHAPQAQIWVGEIAAAWHSGRDNVTNRFVSSFWYTDALGTLAAHNHTGFCRQAERPPACLRVLPPVGAHSQRRARRRLWAARTGC